MNREPRVAGDYAGRQVEAARRVLVDVGQVLAAYSDSIVLVGGWVPDLLMPDAQPVHVGSIDVDLALDAARLNDGRYAELLRSMLNTGRYAPGEKPFQLSTTVDLMDGEAAIEVDVDFLASDDVKMQKHVSKLVEGFRVLAFPACGAAFQDPEEIAISGRMVTGAENTVHMRVASLTAFVVLKAHAIQGRDKPKDVYDLCYCLDTYPGGIAAVAEGLARRRHEALTLRAIEILREKFATVTHFGPRQLALFHNAGDRFQVEQHERRAFESVQELLRKIG